MASPAPDPSWGSSPADRPPSYDQGAPPALGYTDPGGATQVVVGTPATVELSVESTGPRPATVQWQVAPGSGGLTVSPSAGTLTTPAGVTGSAACGAPKRASLPLSVTARAAGSTPLHIELRSGTGTPLPPVVVDVEAVP